MAVYLRPQNAVATLTRGHSPIGRSTIRLKSNLRGSELDPEFETEHPRRTGKRGVRTGHSTQGKSTHLIFLVGHVIGVERRVNLRSRDAVPFGSHVDQAIPPDLAARDDGVV